MVVVAGIDCGSNSTRLLVSEVNNGEIKKLYKLFLEIKIINKKVLLQRNLIIEDLLLLEPLM